MDDTLGIGTGQSLPYINFVEQKSDTFVYFWLPAENIYASAL